ncbi:MAG TPA: zinc-dependent metalloprotease [Solirubrobacteraceae bacterium]|nr:zinc-dependent metalloprotease [Solirubrobacteraceae bacterium]
MIDWYVAERIAAFVAGTGDAGLPTIDLAPLAEQAEERVVAYTSLQPVRPLPAPEGIGRREWVTSNLDSMRTLLDPVLSRAGENLGPLRPAMQIWMGFLLSTELGVVLGYLAQRVLGQYELVLLDEAVQERPPRLLFVLPNLGQVMRSFGADEREFITWVTLHEVTHAVQFAGVPWLHGHVAGLVRELLAKAEVRLDAPRKLRAPTREEIGRVLHGLRRGDLISIVATGSERELLDRIQAVMAVIEGHAEHVMDAVAPDLVPSLPRLREGLDRRRRSQSSLSRLVAKLLGLDLKMRQYEQGKRFCDAVVDAGGVEALNRVFTGPEALPTLTELEHPRRWLERTAQLVSSG